MPDNPSGLNRREIYIDARDIQSDSDPDNVITPEEYTAILTNRGMEKLSEHQLVKSFSAVVRTLNPTYKIGEDFDVGDTITVIDDRLGITVDAVVQGVEQSVGENGESMSLTLGYRQPTIGDILDRKAEK